MERAKRGTMTRLARLSRLKLLIPLRRSPHSPEYSARGVAVGMFWALTPLVGIQMYLCLMTWLAAKSTRDMQFSLVISFAWTWVTNVFTMLPVYYVFYCTGQLMLGRWDDISGYGAFHAAFEAAFTADHKFWQATLELLTFLARELGLAMSIGCLPYAIIGSWASYRLSLKYIRRRRRKIAEKRNRKAIVEGRAADTATKL